MNVKYKILFNSDNYDKVNRPYCQIYRWNTSKWECVKVGYFTMDQAEEILQDIVVRDKTKEKPAPEYLYDEDGKQIEVVYKVQRLDEECDELDI